MGTKVLVTGANGQLGKTIDELYSDNQNSFDFVFVSKAELDITKAEKLRLFFNSNHFDYCINCAAYTNVEQAEKTPEIAFKVNAEAVKNLATVCKEKNTILIHISTDYVFDGKKEAPYIVDDIPNPINEYGKSKLLGEQYIQEVSEKYFIIRTSWLYSKKYGNNFYRTISRYIESGKELKIINNETGTPTNANDLVSFFVEIILINSEKYGVYHYSNTGEATWYDFAKEILKISGKQESVTLKKIDIYPIFAARPKYSVLNKTKSLESFNIQIPNWIKSLRER